MPKFIDPKLQNTLAEMVREHHFASAQDIMDYVMAGRAVVTLTSQRTQKRYTFRVDQARDKVTNERTETWFVKLLSGPDNTSDYQYMGMIRDQQFRLTTKSSYKADSIPVRAFQFFFKHIVAGNMPPEMEVRHEGACGRCGRTLTVPASIDKGFGPECSKMVGLG